MLALFTARMYWLSPPSMMDGAVLGAGGCHKAIDSFELASARCGQVCDVCGGKDSPGTILGRRHPSSTYPPAFGDRRKPCRVRGMV